MSVAIPTSDAQLAPLLLDVPAGARIRNISRTHTWRLVLSGAIRSRKLGTRRLVKPAALQEFINSLPSSDDAV